MYINCCGTTSISTTYAYCLSQERVTQCPLFLRTWPCIHGMSSTYTLTMSITAYNRPLPTI